jgi:hypothetical protein
MIILKNIHKAQLLKSKIDEKRKKEKKRVDLKDR